MLTESDRLRIVTLLKRFSCNKNESLTYIQVLISGTTSIQELSRTLKQNRISVYYSVQQLIEKGFLFEVRKGKKRFIAAEDPSILLQMLKKQHAELDALEMDVSHITDLLNSIHIVKHEKTIVKLYEDVEGFKKMLDESLDSKGEIIVFSNTPIFSDILGSEVYENYCVKKAARKIPSRIIYTPCAFSKNLNAHKLDFMIELRLLPQNLSSEAGFYSWDDTVAIVSLKENKISCTLIENKDVTEFFRENIFNHFWAEAEEIGD